MADIDVPASQAREFVTIDGYVAGSLRCEEVKVFHVAIGLVRGL
jgi:hypothetical protein